MTETNWMDGQIGWSKEFNKIETCIPDDPAVDQENSDMGKFIAENFDMQHLKLINGKKPVKMEISLPNSAQWASITPYLSDAAESRESASVACHSLFESCVRFPEVEAARPEFRGGLYRLPEQFMMWLSVTQKKMWFVELIGGWLINKYLLSDEEKKA